MSFELINAAPLLFATIAAATLAGVLVLAVGVEFFARNRTVRVARQQTISAYYGQLLRAA